MALGRIRRAHFPLDLAEDPPWWVVGLRRATAFEEIPQPLIRRYGNSCPVFSLR